MFRNTQSQRVGHTQLSLTASLITTPSVLCVGFDICDCDIRQASFHVCGTVEDEAVNASNFLIILLRTPL